MSEEPFVTWDTCDENHGVAEPGYEFWKWIIDGLYDALKAVEAVYDFISLFGSFLRIILPSGVVLNLFNGMDITDFRLPTKKFWAYQLVWNNTPLFTIPLPRNIRFNKDVTSWWHSITDVGGSEHWEYLDRETGVIQTGEDFDPIRYYNVFGDGLQDAMGMISIIAIIYLLGELGLYKAIPKLLSFLGHLSTSGNVRAIEDVVADIEETVESTESMIADMHNIDLSDVITKLEVNKGLLEGIKSAIGLKLTL